MIQAEKYLKILLYLIAIHSFSVACFLILLGEEGIRYFGFDSGNRFFQVQGGIFHIVMCMAYVLATINLRHNAKLILFIIIAKSIATIYLLMYYFLVTHVITILLSGLADGLMGLAVFLLWNSIPNKKLLEDPHA